MPRVEPLLPLAKQGNDLGKKNASPDTVNNKETCMRNCMRKFCDADVKDKCRNTCKTICNVFGACMCFSMTMIILFKFMDLGIKYQN